VVPSIDVFLNIPGNDSHINLIGANTTLFTTILLNERSCCPTLVVVVLGTFISEIEAC